MSDVHHSASPSDELSDEHLAPYLPADAWIRYAMSLGGSGGALHEPTAMALATVDAQGMPDVRVVLMRSFTPAGPVFFTSRQSTKAVQLAAKPVLAASITWSSLFRSIRFRGAARPIAGPELEEYWTGRPWAGQIAFWASKQSHPLESRARLTQAVAQYAVRWPDQGQVDDVPLPPDLTGYRIECDEVEFWAGRRDGLHDRLRFTRIGAGGLDDSLAWERSRLQP